MENDSLKPGQRVRVVRTIDRQSGPIRSVVEGTIVRMGRQKTGSWFAHAPDGKLWLDRLELRRDDGELVVCNLDQATRIEVIPGAGAR